MPRAGTGSRDYGAMLSELAGIEAKDEDFVESFVGDQDVLAGRIEDEVVTSIEDAK